MYIEMFFFFLITWKLYVSSQLHPKLILDQAIMWLIEIDQDTYI